MLSNKVFLKFVSLIAFFAVLIVNALANILPINGIPTGAVSDAYPNLFAPAGVTFSIWGVIYLAVFGYVVYQFFPKPAATEKTLAKINEFFILSSVANCLWLFSWHYQLIGLSVVLMLVLLYSLGRISTISNGASLTLRDKLFIKIPFGLYFGWITIATIANITTFLVSIGWKNFLLPDETWMILVLLIGAAIASWATVNTRNLAYGLVPIWAYYGIYLKHTSPLAFNNTYPAVITTAIVCIFIFIAVNGWLIATKKSL